jgi:hypothetical protein
MAAATTAALEKVTAAATAAVSKQTVQLRQPEQDNLSPSLLILSQWNDEEHKNNKRKLELQEWQQSLKHSRDVELIKLQASHILQGVQLGVQIARYKQATSLPSTNSCQQSTATMEKCEEKKPKSELSILKGMACCRNLLMESGADLSGLSNKPADMVEYAIEFTGYSPALQSNVAAADEMRDKINFVIDAFLE